MFINNVRLNRENALDVQPTRDRVKSKEYRRYWSGEPIVESNSLSSKGKLQLRNLTGYIAI